MESLHENPIFQGHDPASQGRHAGQAFRARLTCGDGGTLLPHIGGLIGNSHLDNTVKLGSVVKNHIIKFDLV